MAEIAARRLRLPTMRAALHRGFTGSQLPLGLTTCVVIGALAFANGGYFPVAWGWSGPALLRLPAGGPLSEPVGYWNAFGVLAAMGTLLALGLAARSGPVVRCVAGASTVVLLLTLYFTFSRGGWIAFFLGLAAAIALDRRRLQLITT